MKSEYARRKAAKMARHGRRPGADLAGEGGMTITETRPSGRQVRYTVGHTTEAVDMTTGLMARRPLLCSRLTQAHQAGASVSEILDVARLAVPESTWIASERQGKRLLSM